ncbi:MAG: alpha/beta hydrolase [Kiritimatiellaeota bacterium]|nr:alpha/beta hydrolase [Kiritimatiellota bacterium]
MSGQIMSKPAIPSAVFERGHYTRRGLLHGLAALAMTAGTRAGEKLNQHLLRKDKAPEKKAEPYPPDILPAGVRSRYLDNINGLKLHLLEAGFEKQGQPCLLLLHGFPELAYSWRKVMQPLAAAGFHVIAPDQRGYGRTIGGDSRFDGDVRSSHMLNLVRDMMSLVSALDYSSVAAVIGHDFGSPVAAWCAIIRPDIFRSVVLMSAPFAGPPALSSGMAGSALARPSIHEVLATLQPPRKHYQWYYSTREANDNMWHCPQGLHDFLRAYYHYKSADWPRNKPFPLMAWTASELAKMPTYYIMEKDKGMAESVAPFMPSAADIAACKWLTETELEVYATEYRRTGFQGGLQWYRCATDEKLNAELQLFAGRTIDVPSCFIAGKSDWGVYQRPGALEKMQTSACKRMLGCHIVEGAGHWVQQEQPEEVTKLLLQFLRRSSSNEKNS